ncbi:MAG: OadG family protein [Clostridia bacterium]|nr:OadG family protein [Clostridia bacterium]
MDFLNNFSAQRFLDSLQYMWKGMLCIFIVIGVIIIFIYGMNKVTNKIVSKKQSKDSAEQ